MSCPGASAGEAPPADLSGEAQSSLDAVLQLSTSPVANECFEASYFTCQPFPAADNCNAGVF